MIFVSVLMEMQKKHTTASKLINLNIAEDSPVVLILKVIPNVEM